MKIKKQTYKIITSSGWKEHQGSIGYDFPFMCHREEGARFWRVSHMLTGYSVVSNIKNLKIAKEKITKLKAFPLFLMPTIETIKKQQDLMKEHNIEAFNAIIAIVKG